MGGSGNRGDDSTEGALSASPTFENIPALFANQSERQLAKVPLRAAPGDAEADSGDAASAAGLVTDEVPAWVAPAGGASR